MIRATAGVIEQDGHTYEVGYDITATQTGLRGQPRLSVWGYNVQGQKADLTVPEVIRSQLEVALISNS